ncbi:hypothetical protein ScPMuIL_008367 [Solemya velum]
MHERNKVDIGTHSERRHERALKKERTVAVKLIFYDSQLFSGMESVRTGVRMVGTANPDDITSTTESIPAYISKMSVLVKPVIYAITDPKFRKELMEGFFPLR